MAALAQDDLSDAVRLEVDAGYDGHYHRGTWFPISVVVSNDGPDIQGAVVWRFPGHTDIDTYQREVDLPRGARKQISFYAYSDNFARIGEVRLVSGKTEYASQQVRLEAIEPDQFSVGVLSSDTTLLNSLSSLQRFNKPSTTVVLHMDPEALPERSQVLRGLDALFLHNITTAELREEQLQALELWVQTGGQLVVSGGSSAGRSVPGLEHLLPVTVGDLASNADLLSLSQIVRHSPDHIRESLPEQATVNRVDLRSGAVALDPEALITMRAAGDGYVFFSAFDFSVLRAWSGEPELWGKVLQDEPHFDPTRAFGWSRNILREVLQFPSLQLPSFGLLVLFIFAYVVIIGPINFLVLRRIKRVELAWATVPLIVLLFVVGTYGASFFVRGTRAELLQVGIVHTAEGETRGQGTAHMGIFSPRRHSFAPVFPERTLINTQDDFRDTPIVWTDTTTEIPNLLVDVSSLRTFVAERPVDLPLEVQSTLEYDERWRIQGEIANTGNQPLTDAMLIYGNTQEQLGTIAPGERVEVLVERNMFNFSQMPATPEEETFNRRQIVSSLFHNLEQNSEFQGVYLLVWGEQPLIDVQLPANVNRQSILLSVIRLDMPLRSEQNRL